MILAVVGARPNFMKMAPVIAELKRRRLAYQLVHTGQHYDDAMSKVFFDELGMPRPDLYLGVGSGSHAEQTAAVMIAIEKICREQMPKLVIVAGDVNSTLAAALAATKLNIPVAHVESGLRSFDRTMPEEINRILTDHISDLLFTSEPSGTENLHKEGIAAHKIHFVGNCMIDSLRLHLSAAQEREPWKQFGLEHGSYGLVTLHRAAAVDDIATLRVLRGTLRKIAEKVPLLFPVHPRTQKQIENACPDWGAVRLMPPLGYLDFLGLMSGARLVLTDSGGIQEETTALRVPCITLRENTERPITVEHGSNRLAGLSAEGILGAAEKVLSSASARGNVPDRWDGNAAKRIGDIVEQWLARRTQAAHA